MNKDFFQKLLKTILALFDGDRKIDTSIIENKPTEILTQFSVKKLYVNSEIGLRVRSSPEIKPDNILETLVYGQEVEMLNEKEKWFEIKYLDNKKGWVSSYYLTETKPAELPKQQPTEEKSDNIESELPVFKVGTANLANDSNAIKLRKIIGDEFGGGKNGWDLQCTEYVQYRVKQNGITIKWPVDRPRDGGKWADIFERNKLYKVLDKPKVSCAVSFTAGFRSPEMNKTGHTAFVEEVLNDEVIKISEANWPPPGKADSWPRFSAIRARSTAFATTGCP